MRSRSSRRILLAVASALLVVGVAAAAMTGTAPKVLTERYRVPSETMLPTIAIGDRLSVNRAVYRNEPPAVGDIVVLHPPAGAERSRPCGTRRLRKRACAEPTPERLNTLYLKRVVAGPGDRVAVRDGRVVLNGEPQAEPAVEACLDGNGCDLPEAITVLADHYFVMGDNRGASFDSRQWGPVPRDWVLGRVERCRLLVVACTPRR